MLGTSWEARASPLMLPRAAPRVLPQRSLYAAESTTAGVPWAAQNSCALLPHCLDAGSYPMTVPHGPAAAEGGCHPAAVLRPTAHGLLPSLPQAGMNIAPGTVSSEHCPIPLHPWVFCSVRVCGGSPGALQTHLHLLCGDSWCPEAGQGSKSCSHLLLKLNGQSHTSRCPPSLSCPHHPTSQPNTGNQAHVSLCLDAPSWPSLTALGSWQKGVVWLP